MTRAMALLLLTACAGGSVVGSDEVVPSFALPDVNPASPSTGRDVAPEDERGHVSAWYFGHST